MTTLHMSDPWKDPRTGIWVLRKRIPAHLKAVSGRRGDVVKISTGTTDKREAARRWPGILAQYAEREAAWTRALNTVDLSPESAREIAAVWAAWVASDLNRLDHESGDGSLFQTGVELSVTALLRGILAPPNHDSNESPKQRQAFLMDTSIAAALKLADIAITASSYTVLAQEMLPVIAAAHRQVGLKAMGATGEGKRWNPLGAIREQLPVVKNTPTITNALAPQVSLMELFGGWRKTTTVKARTVSETEFILKLLEAHVGHDDAIKIRKADITAWRDASKAGGVVNNTWNNRLSMVRQVFEWGVNAGRLPANPAEATLRLKKNKTAARLPYDDAETVRILMAARTEIRMELRWAPWIMAFSGMRVGEVLQLSASDVRQQGGIWFLAVHEDDAEKSVKTGERRNVPVHPALVAEGLLDYARSLPQDGPLFPAKGLGKHGTRGERGWNVTGKWVRDVVGISDTRKAPNHSFRHRLEDELRAVEVPEDVRDAILGHARKTTGRLYGVRGEALGRLHRYLAQVPVPAGLKVHQGAE